MQPLADKSAARESPVKGALQEKKGGEKCLKKSIELGLKLL